MATTTAKPERAATTSMPLRTTRAHAGVAAANAARAAVRHLYDETPARMARSQRTLAAAVDRAGSTAIAARPYDPVHVVTLTALVEDWSARVRAAGFELD